MIENDAFNNLKKHPQIGTALYVKSIYKITWISKFNNESIEFIFANIHLRSLGCDYVYDYD